MRVPVLKFGPWLVLSAGMMHAQETPSGKPASEASAMARQTGHDTDSGIDWVLLSMRGKRLDASASAPGQAPRLTAQCTKGGDGKLKFELLADLGDVPEVMFVAPWRPSKADLYAPRLQHATVTMDFLGYTRVKPVKRQWEYLPAMPGELRYAAPGTSSSNLEEIAFYLQYVRSLPTLRLTVPPNAGSASGAAEWETAAWQAAVRAEPLCHASGW